MYFYPGWVILSLSLEASIHQPKQGDTDMTEATTTKRKSILYIHASSGAYGHGPSTDYLSKFGALTKVHQRSYATVDTGFGPGYVNTSAEIHEFFTLKLNKEVTQAEYDELRKFGSLFKVYEDRKAFTEMKREIDKRANEWNRLMKKRYGR